MTTSLNRRLNLLWMEKNWFSKDYTKLRQTWRRKQRNIRILLFVRSIRSSGPNDYSYNRRINWADQARFVWRFENKGKTLPRTSSKKTAKKLKNWGELVEEMQIQRDKQEFSELSTFASQLLIRREGIFRETASSSGATHVPGQPATVPSPRTVLCRDSGLPHNTRNNMGTSGNIFERLPAQER